MDAPVVSGFDRPTEMLGLTSTTSMQDPTGVRQSSGDTTVNRSLEMQERRSTASLKDLIDLWRYYLHWKILDGSVNF